MKQQYIIYIVCVLVAVISIWREVHRENKAHLWLRVIAILVAILALACIILPVSYNGKIDVNDKKSAVLLTNGFNADSIADYKNLRVFTLDKSVKKTYPKATLISDLSEISTVRPSINKLHVFGYGLNEYQLKQLNNLPLSFHTVDPPNGIISVSWSTNLNSGDQLHVQGTYNNAGQPVKLILKGLGTTLDSTVINKGKNLFDLSATPKNTGRSVFRLLAIRDADTLENESLPIELNTVKPLKVLILASAPDFENNFLKNWLSTHGYGVAVRNMISKDKFSQDFVNVEQQSLQHLTPAILSKFDVLLSDLDLLKTMAPNEAFALKQEVEQKGLGIIVRADSTASSSFWLQRSFPAVKTASQGQLITALKVQGHNAPTAKLMIDPVYISTQNLTQPLITDTQNHAVTAIGLAGSGKVVFTTLNNTHSLMLGGDETDYTLLWSLMISKAAKSNITNGQWVVKTPVPTVNDHVKLQLESAAPNSSVKVNQSTAATAAVPSLPYATQVDYWPQHAGWQHAQQVNGAEKWWFVYPANEWLALRQSKQINDTKAYAARFNNQLTVTKQIHQKVQIEVPKIYFYVLLMASLLFLWIEAKFLS
ncbi:hypothetical protein [Mucilaginibacter sp. KACC 22063]|uniref:hypothetical protein n=1 Tax=Mucilaginibacter sp. KACC 22063 TaxID=3025666 RepID=UPI0023656104|nr:hypothetical protein [Mucilaginibacter sp. KACC 22063]WDF54592.1 hypothetical protein PQ461_16795 [Mucilaginibacter sp. KACC 22063]